MDPRSEVLIAAWGCDRCTFDSARADSVPNDTPYFAPLAQQKQGLCENPRSHREQSGARTLSADVVLAWLLAGPAPCV